MSYYILDQDPRVPAQPTVLSCPDDMKPEDWISGKRMTAPRNPLRLQMSVRTGKFRGVIVKGILTLFHDILREELIRLGIDNLEFFPVELENPEGQIETKYQLVNVIGLLDAVDKSKSVIEPRATGGRGRLRSFRIDPAAARGQHLFRIAEAPTLIVIDEWLYGKLDDFNLAGAWMLPTDEYEGY